MDVHFSSARNLITHWQASWERIHQGEDRRLQRGGLPPLLESKGPLGVSAGVTRIVSVALTVTQLLASPGFHLAPCVLLSGLSS